MIFTVYFYRSKINRRHIHIKTVLLIYTVSLDPNEHIIICCDIILLIRRIQLIIGINHLRKLSNLLRE